MPYEHGKSIIKIAIADDDEMLQYLLQEYIDKIENCKVVIRALNGRELIERLRQKPDTSLVLMDIKMPEMDGVEATKKIKHEFPEIKIMFVSIFFNELAYCRAIGAGADGFIRKGTNIAELKIGIFEVMKNGRYFYNNLARLNLFSTQVNNKHHKENYSLTDEEIAFLKLVCTDKTYECIAADMQTTPRHVEYIRQCLFEKFDVHSRVELALFARDGGMAA
jgi:DNA-binding NarL/FixJ family response regulator